jgi:DNA-binding CsgD family transcriptional regulator
LLLIPEGGSSVDGVKGVAELNLIDTPDGKADLICLATASGGTLAGVISGNNCNVLGIAVVKDASIPERVNQLLSHFIENNIKVPEYLKELYQLKSELYEKNGNFQLAYQYKDSLLSKIKQLEDAKDLTQMVDLNVKLIQDKHQAEIDLLEEKAENERKTKLMVLIFSSLGVILLAYLWYISLKKRKAEKLKFAAEHKQDVEKIESFKKRLMDKNALIEAISAQIDSLQSRKKPSEEEQAYLQKLRDSIILTDEDWIDFKQSFDQVYPNFLSDLIKQYPELSQAEIRFMVLLKLGLSVKEMANVLAILPESVRKTRLRLTKKLGLSSYKELNHKLKQL